MATDTEVGTYDLIIEQGAPLPRTFVFTVTSTGAVRTGLTAADAEIKPSASSSSTLLDLTSYLTVDGVAGTVALFVPQAVVDLLTFRTAVWDMFCTFDGVVEKMFKGSVTVIPNVTD